MFSSDKLIILQLPVESRHNIFDGNNTYILAKQFVTFIKMMYFCGKEKEI